MRHPNIVYGQLFFLPLDLKEYEQWLLANIWNLSYNLICYSFFLVSKLDFLLCYISVVYLFFTYSADIVNRNGIIESGIYVLIFLLENVKENQRNIK